MRGYFWRLILIMQLFSVTQVVWADEAPESLPSGVPSSTAPKKRVKQGKVEKENEGTQAPNRFEGDNVIKSQYQRDGQPLEVDPD